MDMELGARHRQVLGLEKMRRRRGYREGWLYHLCREKGLLSELHELQLAGLVGEAPDPSVYQPAVHEIEIAEDGEILVPRTRLTVELIPSTCWFSNLRSELSKEEWDRLRRATYERASQRCEVCGQRGRRTRSSVTRCGNMTTSSMCSGWRDLWRYVPPATKASTWATRRARGGRVRLARTSRG